MTAGVSTQVVAEPAGAESAILAEVNPADAKLAQFRPDWLTSGKTVLARVPSAIAPHTWNYLLNPEHPDASQVQIVEVIKERFDNRLFRFGAR